MVELFRDSIFVLQRMDVTLKTLPSLISVSNENYFKNNFFKCDLNPRHDLISYNNFAISSWASLIMFKLNFNLQVYMNNYHNNISKKKIVKFYMNLARTGVVGVIPYALWSWMTGSIKAFEIGSLKSYWVGLAPNRHA